MNANVIDTLRYADRLKEAGVETGQAEAMARALNAELTEGLATKADLRNAIAKLENKVDRGFAAVDAKFDAMEAKFDGKFDAMEAKFDGKFDAMEARLDAMEAKFDAKFEAMDAKFEALAGQFKSQSRHVFLVLALVVALGLYNAIAPRFAASESDTTAPVPASAASSQPIVPTAPGTAPPQGEP